MEAVGMVELSKIYKGYDVCDKMMKAADVTLLRSTPICPGKHIILFSGDTGAVETSLQTGINVGEKDVVNTFFLPNIHPTVINVLRKKDAPRRDNALGILEFRTVAAAVEGADAAVKAADVHLIQIRIGQGIGGKGVFIMEGEVSAVQSGAKAAQLKVEGLLGTTVIPNPDIQMWDTV